MMTGIDMVHVPASGEMQAQTDLLAGRVDVMFDPISSSIGYIRAGKLRALAVTTATRLQILPDVPTVGEFVPGYEVDGRLGIGAPNGTPAAVIATLNSTVNAGLGDPGITARFDRARPCADRDDASRIRHVHRRAKPKNGRR